MKGYQDTAAQMKKASKFPFNQVTLSRNLSNFVCIPKKGTYILTKVFFEDLKIGGNKKCLL